MLYIIVINKHPCMTKAVCHFCIYFENNLGSPCKRPIPDINNWDLQMKRDWIYKETHVSLTEIFQTTNLHEKVVVLDEAFKQGFTCHQTNCEKQFQLHSTRVRYCHAGTYILVHT